MIDGADMRFYVTNPFPVSLKGKPFILVKGETIETKSHSKGRIRAMYEGMEIEFGEEDFMYLEKDILLKGTKHNSELPKQ